jgi:hypothetical protein
MIATAGACRQSPDLWSGRGGAARDVLDVGQDEAGRADRVVSGGDGREERKPGVAEDGMLAPCSSMPVSLLIISSQGRSSWWSPRRSCQSSSSGSRGSIAAIELDFNRGRLDPRLSSWDRAPPLSQ